MTMVSFEYYMGGFPNLVLHGISFAQIVLYLVKISVHKIVNAAYKNVANIHPSSLPPTTSHSSMENSFQAFK